MIDYFAILGLPTSASVEDIKKAYRKLALKYHPDRNTHPEAKEMFMKVNEAYSFLMNPSRRASYASAKNVSEKRKEEFYKRKQAKLATGCGKLFGLIILFISFMVIFMPWMAYFGEEDIEKRISLVMVLFLSIIGVVFLVGAYKMNFEEQ